MLLYLWLYAWNKRGDLAISTGKVHLMMIDKTLLFNQTSRSGGYVPGYIWGIFIPDYIIYLYNYIVLRHCASGYK